MKFKALFIMIVILLATLRGVAQEAIVVFESAITNHNVENHPGSSYEWEIFKNLNPDVPADPTEAFFTSTNTSNETSIQWLRAGIYYLKVTETDSDGCTNAKALVVSVVPDERTIGFEVVTSEICEDDTDNSFVLALSIKNNAGADLGETYFPLEVGFTVNGTAFTQTVPFANQELLISDDMFAIAGSGNTQVVVEISDAEDVDGNELTPSANREHTRTIFEKPEIEFLNASVEVVKGDNFNHQVRMTSGAGGGAIYTWSVSPTGGTSTDLTAINSNIASILWDGAVGTYTLSVQASDVNGCVSNVATQTVQVTPPIILGDLLFSSEYPDVIVCSDLANGAEGSTSDENSSTFEVNYTGDANLASATVTVQNPNGEYVDLNGNVLLDQLNPELIIDNNSDSKQIQFAVLHAWENSQNANVSYQISLIRGELSDGNLVPGEPQNSLRTITVLTKPEIEFVFVPDTIEVNTSFAFEAIGEANYTYSWWFVNESGDRTDFTSTTNTTEAYLWDTEGVYTLFAQASDAQNCLTEIISEDFVVAKTQGGGGSDTTKLFAIPDFVIGVENMEIAGNVSTNDFIFPYDTSEVIYRVPDNALSGLTFNPDGTYTYQTGANQTGKVYFNYELCFKDGSGECSTAEVEIRILSSTPSENNRPLASTDVVLTLINQPVSGNTLVNDANYSSSPVSGLSISEIPVQSPENGTLELFADGTFTYTPNDGFVGVDQFRYQLCNSQEQPLCDSAWVYIYVNTFDSENQSPPISVYDDLVVYQKDSVYSVALNDFAIDDQILLYNTTLEDSPNNGTVRLTPTGEFNYIPFPGFVGVDWFVYKVCGGLSGTNCRTATAYVLVGEQVFLGVVEAGKDTTIGSCKPFVLEATVSDTVGMSYLWTPDTNLDDPTILNPVFTPGNSSTFTLTVTNSFGASASDTVRIDVSEVFADAGEDFVIEEGTNAILDGTGSFGAQLEYFWTTENGTIESGVNSPNPVISSAGTYYLQVSDSFACFDTDSVVVSWVAYAPIARDNYDTTQFQTAIRIPVLENDEDPDGDLDPSSLSITVLPLNGTAFVNFDDYTVTYIPNDGYVGNDVFEYQICDLTNLCDNANVYVLVTQVDFLIPEAFTPNADNINDYFEIKGIEYYPGNKLTVVNRWGKKVYEEQNYGIDTNPRFWDGKNSLGDKSDLPSGTYFYVLDLGNGQKPIAGSVYIDR